MTSSSSVWQARRLRFALVMLAAGALIGLVVAFFTTRGVTETPLLGGQVNLATAFLYVLPIVSGLTTALGYRRQFTDNPALSPRERLAMEQRGSFLQGRIVTTLVVAGLVFVATALVFYVLTDAFADAVVPRLVTVALSALGGALAGFAVGLWIVSITTRQLLVAALLFMVAGLLLSVIHVYDPLWWQNAISFMSHDSGSAMFFRLTLIIGGLAVAAVAEDVAGLFRIAAENGQISQRSYRLLRVGLLAAAFGIVGVGLFPTVVSDVSDFLHNVFASTMIGAVMLGMFTVPLLAPVLPPSFRVISLVCGVLAVALFVAWAVLGLLIFVVFQVLILSLSGLWALIFLRYTLAFVRETPAVP
jgi:hypothetical protein